MGSRWRDAHSGMTGPRAGLRRIGQALSHPRWLWDVGINGRPHSMGNFLPVVGENSRIDDYVGWIGQNFDASLTWRDIDTIREHWDGPLVIKGILDPEDAREAVKAGADGIVVSNHGGRQLDGAPGTIEALPAIVEAVGGRIPVLLDGGIRRGADVVKALALGARACLIGRPQLWGLAVAGEAGVAQVLEIYRREIDRVMGLCGIANIAAIGPDLLLPPRLRSRASA